MNREARGTWALRAGATLLAMMMAWPAMSAERAWRTLDAQHYRVVSQLSERETTAWTREFDQFIASMTGMLRLNPKQLPPLTVMLFARDKDYTRYKLATPSGRTANVAGQFSRQETWSIIGLAWDADSDSLRQTILHEATHWIMSAGQVRHPAWFSEGIAELLATFEYRGAKVNWAKPLEQHLATLQEQRMMPLREFLSQPSALFDRDDRTGQFYAQSWAFTHFLLYSGYAGGPQLLTKFLEVYQTRSGEATVDEVMGANLPAIEQAFRSYTRSVTFNYTAAAAAPQPALPATKPAAPGYVEASLGFLALGADRLDLAREHALKAIELDATAPGGHEILAYLAVQKESLEDIARHTADALARGSKDSDMFMLLANALAQGEDAGENNIDRRRANLYENAINLSAYRLEAYERLAETLFNVEKPTTEDQKFLQLGLTAYPGNDWIRVGSAVVAFRLGNRDEGLQARNRALLPGSTLDEQQRRFAAGFLQHVSMQPLQEKLQIALERRDADAVRQLGGELLADPDLPNDMRQSLRQLLDSMPQNQPAKSPPPKNPPAKRPPAKNPPAKK